MAYIGNSPVQDETVSSAQIIDGAIVNADVNSSAAIAISKTALVAGTGITLSTNTLNLDAAQTGITSLLATDIKFGEDDQTKIDFETADEIHFYAANVEQVYLGDNIFGPQSDSDVDLGATGVRWKDAFVDSITVTGEVDAVTLDISGNADIDGTTNLDVVDIDGAVNMAADLTMGANIIMGDDTSIGIADDAERIEFDGAGDISVLGANFGIGTASPSLQQISNATVLNVHTSTANTRSILELSSGTNNDDTHIGSVFFSNSENADGSNMDADGKLISAITVLTETSDSNGGDDSGGHLAIFTKPEAGSLTERMRITSAGNVGIGTASPTHTMVLKTDSGGSTNVLKIEEKDSTDAIVQLSFGGDYDEGSIHVYNGGTSKINLRGNGASYINGGNLGIGTTSPDNLLQLEFADGSNTTAGNIADESVTGLVLTNTTDSDGNGTMIKMESNNGSNATAIAHIQDDATSSHMAFYTELSGTFSEKMRIQHDGNVQIPDNAKFRVGTGQDMSYYHTGTDSYLQNTTGHLYLHNNAASKFIHILQEGASGGITLSTNNTERMRIDSSGNLGIGAASFGPRLYSIVANAEYAAYFTSDDPTSTNAAALGVRADYGSGTRVMQVFYNGGSNLGEITYNGSAITYGGTSDERLKKDISSYTGGLSIINQMGVKNFTWKEHDKKDVGLIAQELYDILPSRVVEGTGEDEVDRPWQVDYPRLVPYLINAIQELSAEVEKLKGN